VRQHARRLVLAAAIGIVGISAAWPAAPATDAAATGGSGAGDFATVVIDGTELFALRGFTTISSTQRVAVVESRIRELARDRTFDPATLEVAAGDHYTRIGPLARPIVRVGDDDADIEGLDRPLFVALCVDRIQNAIVSYRAGRTREALVGGVWRATAATALAAIVLFVLLRSFRALQRWVERRYGERVKTVTIRSFEILRAERIWGFVRGLVGLVGGVAAVAVVVGYLRYAFGLFPWTRGIALHIDDWVLSPLMVLGSGFLKKIPDLIFLAVLFIVTRYALRMIRSFFAAAGRGEVELAGFEPDWAEPTYKIVRWGLIAFVIVIAYPYIPGSSSSAFQGVSIFLGVLLSLGSSSVVANVIAGYTMIYRRAFREGDVVKIGGTLGYVSKVRLQVTHLRTTKNEEVVIPNATILAAEVVNYDTIAKTEGLILHTTVGIGYETPWRQVEAMLLEAADRTGRLAKNPKPFVHASALGDFAVTYEINGYCENPREMVGIYSELHRHILDVFNEYGVQIMTPAYEGDPHEPKIVPKDKFHLPPAKP
jgi:small-conductance mechanosensitive channel